MDDITMKAAAAYSIEKDGEVVNSEYFQAEYEKIWTLLALMKSEPRMSKEELWICWLFQPLEQA